jgi:hypothetical protein
MTGGLFLSGMSTEIKERWARSGKDKDWER